MSKQLAGGLIGAGAALLRFLVGWWKGNEAWEGLKTLRTAIVGIITGGIVGTFLFDDSGTISWLEVKQVFAASFLGTVTVEDVLIGAYRTLQNMR